MLHTPTRPDVQSPIGENNLLKISLLTHFYYGLLMDDKEIDGTLSLFENVDWELCLKQSPANKSPVKGETLESYFSLHWDPVLETLSDSAKKRLLEKCLSSKDLNEYRSNDSLKELLLPYFMKYYDSLGSNLPNVPGLEESIASVKSRIRELAETKRLEVEALTGEHYPHD